MDPTVPPFPEPKKRPRVWWFVLGVAVIIASLVAGVLLTLRLFDGSSFFSIDARVPADDQPHSVTVGTDSDRFLWVEQYGGDGADCVIRDDAIGSEIPVSPVTGTFTRTGGSGAWVADGVFNPGSGHLTVTCSSEEGPVEIGPAVDVGGFVGGILLVVLVPLGLFLLGSAILTITGILWAVRKPR